MSQNKKVKKPFYKRIWFWLIVIVLVIVVGAAMGNKSDTGKNSSTEQSDPLTKTYKVGETASYKGYKIKVNSVQDSQGDDINTPDQGKQFKIVNVTITNDTDEKQSYNTFDFKLSSDGNSTDMTESWGHDNALNSGDLEKGASVAGNLVGQAKVDAKSVQLLYKTSIWNDKTVKFNLK